MTNSNYVFIEGEAIDVGNHGDTDYLFHSGDPVPNTGISSFVYESGIGLGGASILDDYEDGDMSEYSVLNSASASTENPFNGSYSCKLGSDGRAFRDDSPRPEPGDSFGVYWYHGTGDSSDQWIGFAGVSGADISQNDGYSVETDPREPWFALRRFANGGKNNLTIDNTEIPQGEWQFVRVDWHNSEAGGSDKIRARIWKANSDGTLGTKYSDITATDTNYGAGAWGNRKANPDGGTYYFDDWQKL